MWNVVCCVVVALMLAGKLRAATPQLSGSPAPASLIGCSYSDLSISNPVLMTFVGCSFTGDVQLSSISKSANVTFVNCSFTKGGNFNHGGSISIDSSLTSFLFYLTFDGCIFDSESLLNINPNSITPTNNAPASKCAYMLSVTRSTFRFTTDVQGGAIVNVNLNAKIQMVSILINSNTFIQSITGNRQGAAAVDVQLSANSVGVLALTNQDLVTVVITNNTFSSKVSAQLTCNAYTTSAILLSADADLISIQNNTFYMYSGSCFTSQTPQLGSVGLSSSFSLGRFIFAYNDVNITGIVSDISVIDLGGIASMYGGFDVVGNVFNLIGSRSVAVLNNAANAWQFTPTTTSTTLYVADKASDPRDGIRSAPLGTRNVQRFMGNSVTAASAATYKLITFATLTNVHLAVLDCSFSVAVRLSSSSSSWIISFGTVKATNASSSSMTVDNVAVMFIGASVTSQWSWYSGTFDLTFVQFSGTLISQYPIRMSRISGDISSPSSAYFAKFQTVTITSPGIYVDDCAGVTVTGTDQCAFVYLTDASTFTNSQSSLRITSSAVNVTSNDGAYALRTTSSSDLLISSSSIVLTGAACYDGHDDTSSVKVAFFKSECDECDVIIRDSNFRLGRVAKGSSCTISVQDMGIVQFAARLSNTAAVINFTNIVVDIQGRDKYGATDATASLFQSNGVAVLPYIHLDTVTFRAAGSLIDLLYFGFQLASQTAPATITVDSSDFVLRATAYQVDVLHAKANAYVAVAMRSSYVSVTTNSSNCFSNNPPVASLWNFEKAIALTLLMEDNDIFVSNDFLRTCNAAVATVLMASTSGTSDVLQFSRNTISVNGSADTYVIDWTGSTTVVKNIYFFDNALLLRGSRQESCNSGDVGLVNVQNGNTNFNFTLTMTDAASLLWVMGGLTSVPVQANAFNNFTWIITGSPSLAGLSHSTPARSTLVSSFALASSAGRSIYATIPDGKSTAVQPNAPVMWILSNNLCTSTTVTSLFTASFPPQVLTVLVSTPASVSITCTGPAAQAWLAMIAYSTVTSVKVVMLQFSSASIAIQSTLASGILALNTQKVGSFVVDFDSININTTSTATLVSDQSFFGALQLKVDSFDYLVFSVVSVQWRHMDNFKGLVWVSGYSRASGPLLPAAATVRFQQVAIESNVSWRCGRSAYIAVGLSVMQMVLSASAGANIIFDDITSRIGFTTSGGTQAGCAVVPSFTSLTLSCTAASPCNITASRLMIRMRSDVAFNTLSYAATYSTVVIRDSQIAASLTSLATLTFPQLGHSSLAVSRVDASSSDALALPFATLSTLDTVTVTFANNTIQSRKTASVKAVVDLATKTAVWPAGSTLALRCNRDGASGATLSASDSTSIAAATADTCQSPCTIALDCNLLQTLSVSGTEPQCVCNCKPVVDFTATVDDKCDLDITAAALPTNPPIARTKTIAVPRREVTKTLVVATTAKATPMPPPVTTAATTANVTAAPATTTTAPIIAPTPRPSPAPSTTPVVHRRTTTRTLKLVTAVPTAAPTTPSPNTSVPATPAPPTAAAVAQILQGALPSSAASAVSSSGSSAVAVAGTMNPSAANKGANLANILSAVNCRFTPDSLQTSPTQTIVTVSVGSGPFGNLVGGTITSLSFVLGNFVLQFGLFKLLRHRRTFRRWMGNFGALLVSFLLPNVASFGTTMAVHGDTAAVRGFAALAFVGLIVLFGGPLYVVLAKVPSLKHMESADEFIDEPLFAFVLLAEGSRDTTRLSNRVFFFEDLFVALLLGVVGGWQPDSVPCTVVGSFTLAISVLHTIYVARRKVASKVDYGFSLLIAVGQVALAAAAMAMIISPSNDAISAAVGYLALFMSASFMVQAVVCLGLWIREHYERRQVRRAEKALHAANLKSMAQQQQRAALQVPLLDGGGGEDISHPNAHLSSRPSSEADVEVVDTHVVNPLDQPHQDAPPPPPPRSWRSQDPEL